MGVDDGKNIASPTTKRVKTIALRYRLLYTVASFVFQHVIVPLLNVVKTLYGTFAAPTVGNPDLVKFYPSLKSLPIRIFYPPSYDPDSRAKLPTLLTIHGGGFTLGNPEDNDSWNRAFSKSHSFLVVALNYPKAPGHPYPAGLNALESLTSLVLADSSLPIDPARVAVAGWSAGGNLALCLSQLPSLHDKIKALIPLYPIVDFITEKEIKTATRRYKPSLGGFRARETDFLIPLMGWFNWSYLRPGTSCHEPLLSPCYADREKLCKNIFMIACEMDMLAAESWRMISSLAGRRVPLLEEVVGKQEVGEPGQLVTENDERFAWEVVSEEFGTRYRWLLVPDAVHGFDQENFGRILKADPQMASDRVSKTEKVVELVGKWLLEGPLKERS